MNWEQDLEKSTTGEVIEVLHLLQEFLVQYLPTFFTQFFSSQAVRSSECSDKIHFRSFAIRFLALPLRLSTAVLSVSLGKNHRWLFLSTSQQSVARHCPQGLKWHRRYRTETIALDVEFYLMSRRDR